MAKQARNARANMVSIALENSGWDRDPFEVTGAIAEWNIRFPNVPMVADGRKATGFTRAGRGTTAFDLFRCNAVGRIDMLSIKTEAIEPGGKLPSKISLSTGKDATLTGILEGIRNGESLATLIFASGKDSEGNIQEQGLALFLNLGEVLQGEIPFAPEGGYGRGKSPAAYFKWSAARKSGSKRAHAARGEKVFPYVDSEGRRWIAADKVCYPELVVSLYGAGIRRNDWVDVHVSELPALVNGIDWNTISWGADLVG